MSYASEVLADSPRAWYRLATASGQIQDSSGNARHGTEVHGAPTYSQTGPITSEPADKAMLLHSSGPDWFLVPYNAAFDIGDTFTIECWIKRSDTVTTEMGLVLRDQGFFLGLTSNRVLIARASVAEIARSTTQITDTTTWHHLVITKAGATVKQYIDGVDRTGTVTNSTCANGTTPVVKIGADSGGEPFNGYLDEVAIYATALSQARVSAHYAAATFVPPTVPTEPLSLTATAGDSQVALIWSAPASNGGSAVTGYKIYRSTSPNTESLIASPSGTGTTYTDSLAVNATTYYYRVSAANAAGDGPWGNEVSATPVSGFVPTPDVITRTFKRLYGPTLLSTSAATLYTVPASTSASIRHIHVSNPSASPVNFTMSIGTNATGTRIWDATPIPAGDVLDHYQDFTLVAGEILQALASSAAVLNLVVDGYEVGETVAPPPPTGSIYPGSSVFPSDFPAYPDDSLLPH